MSYFHPLDYLNRSFGKDFGLFPMVVPLEKIVEFRWVHLLGSFQSHIECFDRGDDDWLMNQVPVMLLWAENLD